MPTQKATALFKNQFPSNCFYWKVMFLNFKFELSGIYFGNLYTKQKQKSVSTDTSSNLQEAEANYFISGNRGYHPIPTRTMKSRLVTVILYHCNLSSHELPALCNLGNCNTSLSHALLFLCASAQTSSNVLPPHLTVPKSYSFCQGQIKCTIHPEGFLAHSKLE